MKLCYYTYCHGLCLSVSGGRGAGSREPSWPRPHSRPELVPGPGASPQALWRIWRPGLGHRTVPRRCRIYPCWSSSPGQTCRVIFKKTCLSYPFIQIAFVNGLWFNIHICFLFYEYICYFSALSHAGAQPVQLYQGGRGLCVSWTCEALFQTDPGVQTSVHHSYKPRRQATGCCAFLSCSLVLHLNAFN